MWSLGSLQEAVHTEPTMCLFSDFGGSRKGRASVNKASSGLSEIVEIGMLQPKSGVCFLMRKLYWRQYTENERPASGLS